MELSENNQAILLLVSHFSEAKSTVSTPLTPTEYGRFSRWLYENKYQPKDLFTQFKSITDDWQDPKDKITAPRLKYLLGRGAAMGISLEKWRGAGIWIISRADNEYPEAFKRKLKNDAPAILFGVGNKQLLNTAGVSIVGSRSISDKDQLYATQIAQSAASDGMNVISGGAKGVDMTAMQAALKIEGTAVGVLANDLMKSAVSGVWRPFLKKNDLCLVSPYYPEAPFHVGNAMGRNKYIYCLSDYGVVVRSDKDKGGTWAGAIEAMKKDLAPVFVNPDADAVGNAALLERGGHPLRIPSDLHNGWLKQVLKSAIQSPAQADEPKTDSPPALVPLEISLQPAEEAKAPPPPPEPDETSTAQKDIVLNEQPDQFYRYFEQQLQLLLNSREVVSLKDLKACYRDLAPKQLTDWLTRAVDEGLIIRQGRAQQYMLSNAAGVQKDLLGSAPGSDT